MSHVITNVKAVISGAKQITNRNEANLSFATETQYFSVTSTVSKRTSPVEVRRMLLDFTGLFDFSSAPSVSEPLTGTTFDCPRWALLLAAASDAASPLCSILPTESPRLLDFCRNACAGSSVSVSATRSATPPPGPRERAHCGGPASQSSDKKQKQTDRNYRSSSWEAHARSQEANRHPTGCCV